MSLVLGHKVFARSLSAQSHTLSRIPASPSPTKSRPPFSTHTSSNPRPPSRPTSPSKSNLVRSVTHPHPQTNRVPSSSSFNPSLPPKTPKLPGSKSVIGGNNPPSMRLPRRDESMLSVNGSPLANPYQFGMGWFKGIEQAGEGTEDIAAESESSQPFRLGAPTINGKSSFKPSKSSIVVRRDPSVAFPSTLNGLSPANSQSTLDTVSSLQVPSTTHSRNPSQSVSQSTSNSLYPTPRFPTTHPFHAPLQEQQTPRPMSKVTRTFSALVAIPTKDGHLLEFDPLQTSPGSIDALEGITESAKKQAKQEMSRLVQAAVDKWKIG